MFEISLDCFNKCWECGGNSMKCECLENSIKASRIKLFKQCEHRSPRERNMNGYKYGGLNIKNLGLERWQIK